MMSRKLFRVLLILIAGFSALAGSLVSAARLTPEELLQQLDEYPHARQIAFFTQEVVDHEVGLGAIQKIRGEWRFKSSERLSGTLVSYTWQIVDGFSSAEVMKGLLDAMAEQEGSSLLFACKGRACGQGAQWANRVFHERLLYGREDQQKYRVYALQGGSDRLIAFSAARSEDRQYLHVELLLVDD